MQTQYSVLGYKIDLYFYDYKHAIEIDERVIKIEILTKTKSIRKRTLIDELSNKLLRLQFKKNNFIKTKCLKYVAKKILPNL